MLPIEIHDRGRGPELKGTRITVYDIIPYRLKGRTPEQIAAILRAGYPDLTAAHIEALFRYMDEHHDEGRARVVQVEQVPPLQVGFSRASASARVSTARVDLKRSSARQRGQYAITRSSGRVRQWTC